MLGLIILVALQFAIGYVGTPQVLKLLPLVPAGDLGLIAKAGMYAIVIWFVGIIAAVVLKDVASPTPQQLTAALIGSVAVAGVLILAPQLKSAIPLRIPTDYFPLIAAIIGYVWYRKK